jgi:hypothetical protein
MMSGDPHLIELASGIDALYLSGRGVVPESLFARLAQGRAAAEELRCPLPLSFGGVEFSIAPHGFGRYRFCLVHENGRIGVGTSSKLPTFRIQPVGEFLHGVGPSAALMWFRQVLQSECDEVVMGVSRLDVFCDVEGWELFGEDRHRFVCRARRCRTNEDAGVLTGFEFGQRTSKTLFARIYDKTVEIESHGAGYVSELWGSAHHDGAQVWRVEFEIGRLALFEFGIDSPEQAIEHAGHLWRYCTAEWLSLRVETVDGTKARWPLDPLWLAIGQASIATGAQGAARLRAASGAKLLERLLPGLLGYLSSFAVLVGTTGIADTTTALARLLHRHEADGRQSFAERIALKRRRAALS